MISGPTREVDVLVVGGGPAGIAAAVAAGRMGASVVLMERYPILGGMATVGLVGNFCPAHFDGTRFIIGGLLGELRRRLLDAGKLYQGDQHIMEPYDPDAFDAHSRALCSQADVDIRLDQPCRAVRFGADGLASAPLPDGGELIARAVIDATGDATVAHAAGVETRFGRRRDRKVMPLTFCYSLGPVDLETVRRELPAAFRHDPTLDEDYVSLGGSDYVNEHVARARQSGEITIPRNHISTVVSIPGRPRYVMVNYGRVMIDDPTDPAQLEQASQQGRKQVDEGVRFFRKYVPGFQQASLDKLALQIGVRQSRQIVGLYEITAEDVLGCRQFDDVVAQCCYPIDIHEPGSDTTTMKYLPDGEHYDIPWRCLVPQAGPDTLVVAGRCISATHEAMSSLRVIPPAMATGEAAGVSAVLALRQGAAIRELDPGDVQQRLLDTGGILS